MNTEKLQFQFSIVRLLSPFAWKLEKDVERSITLFKQGDRSVRTLATLWLVDLSSGLPEQLHVYKTQGEIEFRGQLLTSAAKDIHDIILRMGRFEIAQLSAETITMQEVSQHQQDIETKPLLEALLLNLFKIELPTGNKEG